MRVIALIEDPSVIRRILEHLGLWAPETIERAPPLPPEARPTNAVVPLTYHPKPDIAYRFRQSGAKSDPSNARVLADSRGLEREQNAAVAQQPEPLLRDRALWVTGGSG